MHMQEITLKTDVLTLDSFVPRLFVLCTPHGLLEHFRTTALLPSSTGLVTIDLNTFGRSR